MIQELKGKYRPFSNFWSCFVKYEGVWYPSVENAYQAAKMANIEDRKMFEHCKASEAKQLGRIYPMREDWEEFRIPTGIFKEMCPEHTTGIQHRIVIMYNLVYQKFAGDSFLFDLLLSTDDEQIEEGNWWGDTFWGTVNGKGENWLGRILMKLRTELRNASNT